MAVSPNFARESVKRIFFPFHAILQATLTMCGSQQHAMRWTGLVQGNQPKVLVASERYHVTITTSICVKNMVRLLDGNTGKYGEMEHSEEATMLSIYFRRRHYSSRLSACRPAVLTSELRLLIHTCHAYKPSPTSKQIRTTSAEGTVLVPLPVNCEVSL